MQLTPPERDKLVISMAAEVARRRLARGERLNHPGTVALITGAVVEGAGDGRGVADMMEAGGGHGGRPGDDPRGAGRGHLPRRHQARHRSPADPPGRALMVQSIGARPLIPDEVEAPDAAIALNEGREAVTVMVASTDGRPVHVGSRFHLFEANAALLFDRAAARGHRLDIPAGAAARFEPGQPWRRSRGARLQRPGRGAAVRLALILLLLPLPALAQGLDCDSPKSQTAMNLCAARALEAADAELNRAYAGAIDLSLVADPEGGLERRLREAQRAWIAFRDAACDVEAAFHEGGSMQPMVISNCLERLTWARAEDLYILADNLGLGTGTP